MVNRDIPDVSLPIDLSTSFSYLIHSEHLGKELWKANGGPYTTWMSIGAGGQAAGMGIGWLNQG